MMEKNGCQPREKNWARGSVSRGFLLSLSRCYDRGLFLWSHAFSSKGTQKGVLLVHVSPFLASQMS